MYDNSDLVNGISIEQCFHSVLDLALEYQARKDEKAEEYFDILRSCLGVDFSINYNLGIEILLNLDYSDECINSFEATGEYTPEGMHKYIKDYFYSFGHHMVANGLFSQKYLDFLNERMSVTEEIIHYFKVRAEVMENLYNESMTRAYDERARKFEIEALTDIMKTTNLERTKKLLKERIEFVSQRLSKIDMKEKRQCL